MEGNLCRYLVTKGLSFEIVFHPIKIEAQNRILDIKVCERYLLIQLLQEYSKIKKIILMRSYSLFIGIDISRNWIDVCLTINGKLSKMPHGRFDNNPKGFKQMLCFIRKSHLYPGSLKNCFFCMEHTGIYTLPLCRFLETKNLNYTMVSPYHLKHSLGLLRMKSDRLDAGYIARYAYLHEEELTCFSLPSDRLLKIKTLLSLRRRLVKANKGLQQADKELKAFAIPQISKQVSKFTRSTTKPIQKSIKAVEQQILILIKEDPELKRLYDLVLSVKGVGLIIAASLLVYTVGFTAFDNSRKFATYIGLSPFGKSSGSSIRVPDKVSHLANKTLKGLISCGASSAQIHDKELRAYFNRRIEEGKNKFSVQNAIRNKFVHRIFAVVKRGTPYVELYRHRV